MAEGTVGVSSASCTRSASVLCLHFCSKASAECSNFFSAEALQGEPWAF